MNDFFIIIGVIVLLYWRTYKYYNLIDDICIRTDYLQNFTQDIDVPIHYTRKKTIWTTIECVGIFTFTCFAVYLNFGFWPALIYAVFPVNVSGVAWKTGCYLYMTTALLILTGHYYLMNFGILGAGVSVLLYWGAINSSLSALTYPFFLLILTTDMLVTHSSALPLVLPETLLHSTICHLLTLCLFLISKRFRGGIKARKQLKEDERQSNPPFTLKKLFYMTKIVAYYFILALWPSRLGFFHDSPVHIHEEKADRVFILSSILLLIFLIWGWRVNLAITIWCFVMIAPFSGFVSLGMRVAERYTYLFNVGICILFAEYLFLNFPSLLGVLFALYFMRSHYYIKTFKTNEKMFSNSVTSFPDTPENYTNISSYYLDRNQPQQALPYLLMAKKLNPYYSSNVNINLCRCYVQVGSYEKALMYCREALKKCSKETEVKLKLQEADLVDRLSKIRHHEKYLRKNKII